MPIAFRASATSIGAIITAPATTQAGDVMVLLDREIGASESVPSGFSILSSLFDNNNTRQILSYKIANGTEAGQNLSVMSGTEGAKVLLVFSGPASAVTPSTVNEQMTDGDPSGQTVFASGGTPPLIVIAGYGSPNEIDPRTFSPAADGEVSAGPGGGDQQVWLAYKIYNSSPADVTVDMTDEDNDNGLQSCFLAITEAATVAKKMMHYRRLRI